MTDTRPAAPTAIREILAGLPTAASDVLAAQAEISARGLLDQGWTGGGSTYHAGAAHGDVEAAAELLGCGLLPTEVLALESCVRWHLDHPGHTRPASALE